MKISLGASILISAIVSTVAVGISRVVAPYEREVIVTVPIAAATAPPPAPTPTPPTWSDVAIDPAFACEGAPDAAAVQRRAAVAAVAAGAATSGGGGGGTTSDATSTSIAPGAPAVAPAGGECGEPNAVDPADVWLAPTADVPFTKQDLLRSAPRCKPCAAQLTRVVFNGQDARAITALSLCVQENACAPRHDPKALIADGAPGAPSIDDDDDETVGEAELAERFEQAVMKFRDRQTADACRMLDEIVAQGGHDSLWASKAMRLRERRCDISGDAAMSTKKLARTKLQVGTEPFSDMRIDGRPYGATPFYGPRAVDLTLGKHVVDFYDRVRGQHHKYEIVIGDDPGNKLIILLDDDEPARTMGSVVVRKL